MAWVALTDIVKSRSLRNIAVYRRQFAAVTQVHVAKLVDVAPQTLSDSQDMLERACLVFAAAGLKLVGVDEKTLPTDEYRSMIRQQVRYLERELTDLGDTQPVTGHGELR